MHWQYWPLAVTVPAATPAAAPVSVPWHIVQGHLKQIEIDIPPGHSGLTGIAVTYCGTQIYPWELAGWLTPVVAHYSAEWDDEIMATGLAVQAYNTDRYPHTFYLRAEVWPTVGGAPGAAQQPAQAPQPRAATTAAVGGLSSRAA